MLKSLTKCVTHYSLVFMNVTNLVRNHTDQILRPFYWVTLYDKNDKGRELVSNFKVALPGEDYVEYMSEIAKRFSLVDGGTTTNPMLNSLKVQLFNYKMTDD